MPNEQGCTQEVKFETILQRLDVVEREIEREQDFRQTYYRERQERIVFETQIRDSMASMNEKLDKVVNYQESQAAKPGKRWDSIVDKILMLIIAAVITYILAKIGL